MRIGLATHQEPSQAGQRQEERQTENREPERVRDHRQLGQREQGLDGADRQAMQSPTPLGEQRGYQPANERSARPRHQHGQEETARCGSDKLLECLDVPGIEPGRRGIKVAPNHSQDEDCHDAGQNADDDG